MRKIKKFFYKIKLFILNFTYIFNNVNLVKKELNANRVTIASFGGADINFFIKKNNKIFAMMRLAIIDKNVDNYFINRLDKKKRLNKEINAYTSCSKIGITPNLLFSNENCTVCSFVDGLSAEKYLAKKKIDIYSFYELILKQYVKLHKQNITHLDATLKNIFFDENDKCFKIVDFEYYASDSFSIQEQKLYDYLRITDYLLRKNKIDIKKFISILEEIVLHSYSNLDVSCGSSFLKKLNSSEEFKNYLDSKNIITQ